MSDSVQVVTMKSLHDDIQEIKKFIYKSSRDYERIVTLERNDDALESRVVKLENKISAMYVVYGITLAVITAYVVSLVSK